MQTNSLLSMTGCTRRSHGDVGNHADYYGIDLRPASVLPRAIEVELTVMIRKAILAEGAAEKLGRKLGRAPSPEELAAKLGLRSSEHLQLLRSNKRAAHLLMLRHNSRLVVHVAQKYSHWGVDMVDLVTVRVQQYCQELNKQNIQENSEQRETSSKGLQITDTFVIERRRAFST